MRLRSVTCAPSGTRAGAATPFDSVSISDDLHTLTLFENGAEVTLLDVTFAPGAPTNFFLGVDKNTGLSFVQVVPCFTRGTRLATPAGQIPVDGLTRRRPAA